MQAFFMQNGIHTNFSIRFISIRFISIRLNISISYRCVAVSLLNTFIEFFKDYLTHGSDNDHLRQWLLTGSVIRLSLFRHHRHFL